MPRRQQALNPGQNFPNSANKNTISDKLKDTRRSIYQMTWRSFYHELHPYPMDKLIKDFVEKYAYPDKKKLQIDFAQADHGLENVSLGKFLQMSEKELKIHLGDKFNKKIQRNKNFKQKEYKLSTIHHFLYGHSLYFAAISLGFFSKQCFLNFFIRSNYVKDFTIDALKDSLNSLKKSPDELRQQLGPLYHEIVTINKPDNEFFRRYNYTLEELKLLLEKAPKHYVIASLGGDSSFRIDKVLRQLSPSLNLRYLEDQSLETLRQEIPESYWGKKIYQLFEPSKRSKTKQKPFSSLSLSSQCKANPFHPVANLATLEQRQERQADNNQPPNSASSSMTSIWRPF
jgi:hypothetical protein